MQPLQVVGLLAKDGWPLPEGVCEFAGSVIVVSVTSSVLTLAMIAVNRHCLITKSRRFYMWVYRGRNMFGMVFFSWVLPIGVLILPQAVGFGKLGYDEFTHLCAWDFSHPLAKFYQSIAAAIGVAAYSIVLICYSLIYLHLRNHSKALHQHFKHLPQNRIDKKVQVNVKITMNLFYVVCVYMVCVVPYSLCLLAISQSNASARHASLYLALILVVNSCANVVIYGLKHPHFRAVFKCIIACRFAEIPQPSKILQLLLQKSTDNSTSAIPSDKPVNLTSDAWPSHNFNSIKKNTPF
ncbi:melatonin receptor type 1A-like [Diadema antillarum]|uniref:melatonin receptor type 1A-like n=1 Tax=Diadema antillarum TaxID=105358 RepID=UPI003A8554EA